MKRNTIFNLTIIFLTVTTLVACSSLPSDKIIEETISSKEKEVLIANAPVGNFSPCNVVFKTLAIPKKFEKITVMADSVNPKDKYKYEMNEELSNIMKSLSINGVITMTKSTEERFTNMDNIPVKKEVYLIEPTENGSKILVGQTGDDFLLAKFDYQQIEIYNKEQLADDTLKVYYKVIPTQVYNALKKVCFGGNAFYMSDSSTIWLVKKNNKWLPK